MIVIALDHRHVGAVSEALVESAQLAERPARPFDREEVLDRGREVQRSRIGEEQEARVVHAAGDEPGRVLLGVAVRVLEDPVGHPHGQRGGKAGGQDHPHALVERCDPGRSGTLRRSCP